jgi:hypothetical protein
LEFNCASDEGTITCITCVTKVSLNWHANVWVSILCNILLLLAWSGVCCEWSREDFLLQCCDWTECDGTQQWFTFFISTLFEVC